MSGIEESIYPIIELVIKSIYMLADTVTSAVGIPLDMTVVLIAFLAGYGVKSVTGNVSKMWIFIIVGALIFVLKSGASIA